jgi:predicted PurR-regulated permease PerM
MDFFIVLIIILAILAPIGGLIFWFLVIRAVVNHVKNYENEQREIMRLANKYSQQYQGEIPSNIQNDIVQRMGNLQGHIGNMNFGQQQQYLPKYESMASSLISQGFTGIDPSY